MSMRFSLEVSQPLPSYVCPQSGHEQRRSRFHQNTGPVSRAFTGRNKCSQLTARVLEHVSELDSNRQNMLYSACHQFVKARNSCSLTAVLQERYCGSSRARQFRLVHGNRHPSPEGPHLCSELEMLMNRVVFTAGSLFAHAC